LVSAHAQAPAAAKAEAGSGDTRLTSLGRGYAALAAGRATEAERIAAELLNRHPSDHAVWALHIEALATIRPARQAVEAYRVWSDRHRAEDSGLLAVAARGVVREVAASTQGADRLRALEVLAQDGDETARSQMSRLMKEARPDTVFDLAQSGNQQAGAVAVAQLKDRSNPRTGQLLDQLTRRGVAVPPELIGPMLSDPDPRTRATAARAAAAANATELTDRLVALLQDRDSDVRGDAALALRRLGSTEGNAIADELLNSDIPGVRLEALNVVADAPGVAVSALATPYLQHEDELVRVAAARLVARTQPDVAAPVLAEAAANENPAISDEAARVLGSTPGVVIPHGSIVNLLLSPSAPVRVEAGRAALEQARAR
jgi:hypothetical protein